jgi:replicative DNA helicase
MSNELDLVILKHIVSNKNNALSFINECDTNLFNPEVWNFSKIVVNYIKSYRNVPTLRVIEEKLGKSKGNDKLIEAIRKIWAQLDKTEVNEKEYKFDLEKIKNRFAEREIIKFKESVLKQEPGGPIDVQKTLSEMQKALQTIRGIEIAKTHERKTLRDAIPAFTERFNAKRSNPNMDVGLMTGYSVFDKATNGCKPADFILIAGESGFGKCHAKGQLILKYDGTLVKVEDIKVGDLLMGLNSESRKVLSVNTGYDYMYDVVPVKGETWRVNLDHILTCVFTGTNELVDISVKDYMKLPKNSSAKFCKGKLLLLKSPADFNSNNELLLDPYVMGALIGDGSFTHTTVSITSMDHEVSDYFRDVCNDLGLELKRKDKKNCAASTYTLCGVKGKKNIVAKYLEYYGLRHKRSQDKFVPFDYKVSSRKNRLEVLAGLLDTDGSYKTGGYDFISKSKQLAEDVCFIARSLGLAAYMKECQKSCQNNFVGTYYRVGIFGNTDIIPCKIKRKIAEPRGQIKNALHVGFSVIPTNTKEEYYGFTLDGDARYLLGDFTVTHNSLLLMNVAVQVWLQAGSIKEVSPSKEGKNVIFFSLEMPYEDCFNRLLSRLSGIPSIKLDNPAKYPLEPEEFKKVKDALKFIKEYPYEFEIVDISEASANDLDLVLNDVQYRIDAIFVDYLGIMRTNEKSEESDWMKQGVVSYELRSIARKRSLPLFSAVQLNRKAQAKDSAENIGLNRLARSSTIATHATQVLQIENRPKEECFPQMPVHIIKNRKGAKGKFNLIKNLSCATLLDEKPSQNESEEKFSDYDSRDIDDISGKIELLDI